MADLGLSAGTPAPQGAGLSRQSLTMDQRRGMYLSMRDRGMAPEAIRAELGQYGITEPLVEPEAPVAAEEETDRVGAAGELWHGARSIGESTVGGVGELAEDWLGLEGVGDALRAAGEYVGPSVEQDEAQERQARARQQEVEDGALSEAGAYLQELGDATLQAAPSFLSTAAGGATGGVVGGAAFGPVGALVGGLVGAVAASLPMLYSEALDTAKQHGHDVDSEDVQNKALAAAAANTAMEVVAPLKVLRRLKGVEEAAGIAKRSIVKRGARKFVEDGLIEGATEIGQMATNAILFDPELQSRLTEEERHDLAPYVLREYGREASIAFLAGKAIGGTAGGGAAAYQQRLVNAKLQSDTAKLTAAAEGSGVDEAAVRKAVETPEGAKLVGDALRDVSAAETRRDDAETAYRRLSPEQQEDASNPIVRERTNAAANADAVQDRYFPQFGGLTVKQRLDNANHEAEERKKAADARAANVGVIRNQPVEPEKVDAVAASVEEARAELEDARNAAQTAVSATQAKKKRRALRDAEDKVMEAEIEARRVLRGEDAEKVRAKFRFDKAVDAHGEAEFSGLSDADVVTRSDEILSARKETKGAQELDKQIERLVSERRRLDDPAEIARVNAQIAAKQAQKVLPDPVREAARRAKRDAQERLGLNPETEAAAAAEEDAAEAEAAEQGEPGKGDTEAAAATEPEAAGEPSPVTAEDEEATYGKVEAAARELSPDVFHNYDTAVAERDRAQAEIDRISAEMPNTDAVEQAAGAVASLHAELKKARGHTAKRLEERVREATERYTALQDAEAAAPLLDRMRNEWRMADGVIRDLEGEVSAAQKAAETKLGVSSPRPLFAAAAEQAASGEAAADRVPPDHPSREGFRATIDGSVRPWVDLVDEIGLTGSRDEVEKRLMAWTTANNAEAAATFSADGAVLGVGTHRDANNVGMPAAGYGEEGTVYTHTHPYVVAHSAGDVLALYGNKVAAHRAILPDGQVTEIRPVAGVTPARVVDLYERVWTPAFIAAVAQPAAGTLHNHQINQEGFLQFLASEDLIEYTVPYQGLTASQKEQVSDAVDRAAEAYAAGAGPEPRARDDGGASAAADGEGRGPTGEGGAGPAPRLASQGGEDAGDVVFATEEDYLHPSEIAMPIPEGLPPDQIKGRIAALTAENEPIVTDLLQRMDERFGSVSQPNVKDLSKVMQKARRPSILTAKPWHTAAHIRDTYRFKSVVSSLDAIPGMFQMLLDEGTSLVKIDTNKLFEPKEWGWRIIAFDLRMPNGQIVEWYLPLKQLEDQKKAVGHKIFEKWRNKTDEQLVAEWDDFQTDIAASWRGYDEAFSAALDEMGLTRAEARELWSRAESSMREAARKSRSSSGRMTSSGPSGRAFQTPSAVRSSDEPSPGYSRARSDVSSTSANAASMGAAPLLSATDTPWQATTYDPATDAAPGAEYRISTRYPTQKRATENPLTQQLQIDTQTLRSAPAAFAHNMEVLSGYPGMESIAGDPDEIAAQAKARVVDNLTWLYNKAPRILRDRGWHWYDGANRIAGAWGERYGLPQRGVAGVLAALSPQMDWYRNVSLAERVLDVTTRGHDRRWDAAMAETARRIYAKPDFAPMVSAIRGKTFGEVLATGNLTYAAGWLRAFDEAHNDRAYSVVTPEGGLLKPTGKKVAWGSLREIAKAIAVATDPSLETVSMRMGENHKVRSFYNNIISPDMESGDITIDTHAVAAALVRPLSGNTEEVSAALGTSLNKKFQKPGYRAAKDAGLGGAKGLYGFYADAYREAAATLELKPRQLQSITWEAIRLMYPDVSKRPTNPLGKKISQVWSDPSMSPEAKRDAAHDLAGGIDGPSWERPGGRVHDPASRATYKGPLSSSGWSGRAGGGGAGGGNALGVSAGRAGQPAPGAGGRAGAGTQPDGGGDRSPAARGAGGGTRRLAGGDLAPLAGAPTLRGHKGPIQHVVRVAEDYARVNGIDLRPQAEFVEVDESRARRIADAYETMPHAPQDPAVKAAYADLIAQTKAQYDALDRAGYEFFFYAPTSDYGASPVTAMEDLRLNRRMGIFPTAAGFGSSEMDVTDNPMLADTGLRWNDEQGQPQTVYANDLFRAVHDAFGHGMEGAGFRANGEENAWQAHVRLFTGPAVGAITTETRGQNSWLNYGPHAEVNQTAAVEDTVFADQKTGLMPAWTWEEGRAPDDGPASPPPPRGGSGPLASATPQPGSPVPLYVRRDVVDAQELVDWAREAGLETVDPADMHVTVAYSKAPVDVADAPPAEGETIASFEAARPLQLGSALAMPINDSDELAAGHRRYRDAGASHDYGDDYRPHVTLMYDPTPEDLEKVRRASPFTGAVMLSGEVQDTLKEGWRPGILDGDNQEVDVDGGHGTDAAGAGGVVAPAATGPGTGAQAAGVGSRQGVDFTGGLSGRKLRELAAAARVGRRSPRQFAADLRHADNSPYEIISEHGWLQDGGAHGPVYRSLVARYALQTAGALQRAAVGQDADSAKYLNAAAKAVLTHAYDVQKAGGGGPYTSSSLSIPTYLDVGGKEAGNTLRRMNEVARNPVKFASSYLDAAETAMFNGFAPIRRFEIALRGSLGVGAESAFKNAEMAVNDSGRNEALMYYGAADLDEHGAFRVKAGTLGLRPIFDLAVEGAQNKGQAIIDWQSWMAAKRAQGLHARGIRTPLSEADISAALAKGTPQFEAAASEWKKHNDANVDFLVKSGRIASEQGAAMKAEAHYVPFYRSDARYSDGSAPELALEDILGRGGVGRSSTVMGGRDPGIKRIVGGDRKAIDNLMTNMVRNSQAMVAAGMRNRAANLTFDMLTEAGVAKSIKAVKQGRRGNPVRREKPGNAVRMWVAGKEKYVLVTDDSAFPLIQAMAGLQPLQLQGIQKLMANISSIFRQGITLSPAFMMRNAIRGAVSTGVLTSGSNLRLGNNLLTGMRDTLRKGDATRAFMHKSGMGDYSFGQADVGFGRHDLMIEYGVSPATWGFRFRKIIEKMEAAGTATEFGDRVAAFNTLKANGVREDEAAYQALTIMNYGRRGGSPLLRAYLPMMPFLNARLQGLARMAEGAITSKGPLARKQAMLQLALNGGIMAVMSAAIWGLNQMDDEKRERYKAEPQWKRLNYHILYLGDTTVLMPKAFELGHLFSSIPEMALDSVANDMGDEFSPGVMSIFGQTFMFNLMPAAVRPMVEGATNYSFFSRRPIESARMTDLKARDRTEGASELAKFVGQRLGISNLTGLSPLMIQHYIEGYAGTYGAQLTAAVDMVGAELGLSTAPVGGVFGALPVISPAMENAFGSLARDSRLDTNKYLGEFYQTKDYVDQIYNSARAAARTGDVEYAQRLLAAVPGLASARTLMNKTARQMGEVNSAIRAIQNDATMTPRQKRAKLAPLVAARNEYARRVATVVEKIERQQGATFSSAA